MGRSSMRRFNQYEKALSVLARANEQDLRNEFVQSGVVDKFSLQFELGWKLLKGLLSYEGDATATTGSPRDILKAAFPSVSESSTTFILSHFFHCNGSNCRL